MAIQQRRGSYSSFDPSKMIEGELAVVKTNDPYGVQNQGMYYCYQTGKVIRLADYNTNMDTIAKSWAVGPSGSGTSGTDTNNAKYWAGIAEGYSKTPPYIGSNGNWWVWNGTSFVDSGVDASITVKIADVTMLSPTASPYVTNTGTDTDPVFHLYIPRGKGISTITKTASAGLVDTYTITYSDATTTLFYVTNGKTAYQSAVDGGYAGTEAEFYTELAEFKTLALQAQSSADDAETAKDEAVVAQTASETAQANAETAQSKAETAQSNAEIAQANAETAQSKAETAQTNAETAQTNAETAQTKAEEAQAKAETAEANAKTSETNAKTSETNAQTSETNASNSADDASNSATEAKTYYDSITGNVTFQGTTTFANIPTSGMLPGWQYNVTDSFTTDSRFENPGESVVANSFIIYTSSGKWSVIRNGSIEISYESATETILFVK